MNRKPEMDQSSDTVVMPDRQLEQLPPPEDETQTMPMLTPEEIERRARPDKT